MKYLLDFDHTLYDTEKFSQDAEPYKSDGLWVTPAIWDILDAKKYFYDDVFSFIQSEDKDNLVILTAMTSSLGPEAREFQREKLNRSGLNEFFSEIIFMEGDKGPYMNDLYDENGTVFVDDRVDHLLSAKNFCPDVVCIQMIREGLETKLETDSSIPIAKNLNEVRKFVNQHE